MRQLISLHWLSIDASSKYIVPQSPGAGEAPFEVKVIRPLLPSAMRPAGTLHRCPNLVQYNSLTWLLSCDIIYQLLSVVQDYSDDTSLVTDWAFCAAITNQLPGECNNVRRLRRGALWPPTVRLDGSQRYIVSRANL
jgi:hypothetical protein